MTVYEVYNETAFEEELATAENYLVVVHFTSTKTGSSQMIAPHFAALPIRYEHVVFLKVDSERCHELATEQGVCGWPMFIIYKNGRVIDKLQSADIGALEERIKHYLSASVADGSACTSTKDDIYGQGLVDLNNYIAIDECDCLNENNEHNLQQCLTTSAGYLQSDCDAQLILSIRFKQLVKIHSLMIKAPAARAPKYIKLFTNQPHTIDFGMVETMENVQELMLDKCDFENGQQIKLRFVKFQNVHNLQIYVRNNQNDGVHTQIDYIGFIGAPVKNV